MNIFTRAMVAITGHHIDKGTEPEDVGGLSKIGLSICFAAFLAAIQFGIAGWYLGENFDPDTRIIFAAVTAIIGTCIVLIIDRNFIYAADTRADTGGVLTYIYLAIRVFLILAISSLSSQFTLPLLLKSELGIHVQDLKDERYDTAKDRYTNKHEVKEKVGSEQEIANQVNKLKTEIATIPPAIARQKVLAEQCMRDYKSKINASIGPDIDEIDVANLYARDKAVCERQDANYKEAYRTYLEPKKTALVASEEAYGLAHEDATKAKTLFKTDLQRADENNNMYLSVASADVMWSLIRNNPGARAKYIMITVVQLVLELMPLLLKSLLGRSPLGIRVAMRSQLMQQKYEEAEHEYSLNYIVRTGQAGKAKNEQTKHDLTDQIAIQEMKNQLMALKVDTRKKFFDFSPASQSTIHFRNLYNNQEAMNSAASMQRVQTPQPAQPMAPIKPTQPAASNDQPHFNLGNYVMP